MVGLTAQAALRDRRLIYATSTARAFAFGLISVVLGLYLAELGFSSVRVGLLLTATLVGASALTFIVSLFGDRFGRRRSLAVFTLMIGLGSLAYALFPRYPVLLITGLLGAISATGKDRGNFSVVEQAMLPQTATDAERTGLYARYNLISTLGSAAGALAAGVPVLLQRWLHMEVLPSYKAIFLFQSAVAVLLANAYWWLTPAVEAPGRANGGRLVLPKARSAKIVAGLSALFALDSFGGGLVVQSFLAYWLKVQFGFSAATVGVAFFLGGLLGALSFPVAAWLARRIGLVNTMVFTHLPSNLFFAAIALAPWGWLALAFYFCREALGSMDVPTRQSYIMAVVSPEERTAAAGFTTLSRQAAQSVSPSLAGWMVQAVGAGSPFFLAGGVKILYDLGLWLSFRRIKPPEEVRTSP